MKRIRAGDFYKTVSVFGGIFDIYYGYYDELEKMSKYSEPIPIYPDFIKKPQYNPEGFCFVTEMQDICEHYKGRTGIDSCYGCESFCKGEELIGLCVSENKRKK